MKTIISAIALLILGSAFSTGSSDQSEQFYYHQSDENLIKHKYYVLEYNEACEQAKYVTYILTRARLNSVKIKRSDNFRRDPLIATGSASLADYKGSGYDRGHLCPAGDMSFDKLAMSESFFMSNMSPQAPSFNRGIWKRLEEQIRDLSIQQDTLLIYTGPLLDSIIGFIGTDSVAVPYRYFKTIYSPRLNQGIGFILPNVKSSLSLKQFTVSIDSIEQILGANLYNGMPESVQNQFENLKSAELIKEFH